MNSRISSIIAAAFVIAGCGSETVVNAPKHSPIGDALLDRIETIAAGDSYMYGHQDDLMYGVYWHIPADETAYDRSDVYDACGDYPAVLGVELGGIELNNPASLDGNDFVQLRESALKHVERGGVITISWHVRNPYTGGDSWDISSDKAVESVLPGGEKYDLFQGWLDNLADYLLSFKDAEGNAVPMIFRPWHEHTGSWFWWGEKLCTAEQYNALWKMTYEKLVADRGLVDLLWEVSPNSEITEESFEFRYPGDEYVDIIGFDCYCPYIANATPEIAAESVKYYTEVLDRNLTVLQTMGEKHNKSIALSETGYQGYAYPTWWTGILGPVLSKYPVSHVLTWRNAEESVNPGHFFGPYAGGPAADDFKAWVETPEVLMMNDMK